MRLVILLYIVLGVVTVGGSVFAASGSNPKNGNGKTYCNAVHMYLSKGKCADARDKPMDEAPAMEQQLKKQVW